MPLKFTQSQAFLIAISSYLLLFIIHPQQLADLVVTLTTGLWPHAQYSAGFTLLVTNLLIYVSLTVLYCYLFLPMLTKNWRMLRSKKMLSWFLFGIGYLLVTLLIGYGYLLLTKQPLQSVNQARINLLLTSFFGPTLLLVLGVGPFVEEILFRFVLFALGARWRLAPVFIISCSALLFAFIHILPNGQLWMMTPYLSLGFGLALVYHYTHNFWLCFGLHSFNNILSICFFIYTT